MTEAERKEDPATAPEATQTAAATPAPDAAGDPALAALEQKLAETRDQLLRALAEADNTRKRAAREREDTAKFAVAGFARGVLSVADNLQRALAAISPEQLAADGALKSIHEGVAATARELDRLMEQNGIKKIEALGQRFDPNLHEVMFEADTPGQPAGVVIQVIESGYTIHERLLRPARVGVSKGAGDTAGHIDQQV